MGSVMALKLTKIVHFLQICTDRKKPKYIKEIYFYSSDISKTLQKGHNFLPIEAP